MNISHIGVLLSILIALVSWFEETK